MIAITFALPAESSELVRRLEQRKYQIVGRSRIIHGRIGDRDVVILHTGVGQKHCAPAIEQFLAAIRPNLLISSGFAGSLTDRLNVGDVIIADNFSDANLRARLLEGGASQSHPAVRSVRLLTLDSMIDSAEQRAQLAKKMGVDAIDMETETIAHSCAGHAIPIISVRVISDSPAAPFPAPPDVLFDVVRQQTNFSRLIPYVITHPPAAVRLYRFARQISRARESLTDLIVEVAGILGEADAGLAE